MIKYHFVIYDILVGLGLLYLCEYNMEWGAGGFILFYFWQLKRMFHKEKELMGKGFSLIRFNTFFFLMFTLCTYLLPLMVVLGIESEIKILNKVDYNSKYIPWSLFICSIAVTFYSSGYLRGLYSSIKEMHLKKIVPIRNFKKILVLSNIMATFTTLYFLYAFVKARAAGEMDIAGNIATIVNCFIILPIVLCGYMNRFYQYGPLKFFKKYWYILSCALLISISMLSIGDRLMAICLISSLSFIINEFVYRFSKIQLLIALLFGVFFMFLISFTRGRSSLSEGVTAYGETDEKMRLFQDVFPANACLVLGCEVKDIKGYYKPMKLIPELLTPVPFIPSIIKIAFFEGDFSSATLLTNINKTRSKVDDSGIGTHVVADVYVSWGFLGIVLIFYFFGLVVGKLYGGRDRVYYLIATTGIIAWSVFIPRESLFDPYRDATWMVAIFYVFSHIRFNHESNLVQR